MTLRRVLGFVVIAFLVVTPLFGFAGADAAPLIRHKCPRHTGGQHDTTPHVGWKTMRATTPAPPPTPRLALLERLAVADAPSPASSPSRPPFVPPRA